LEAAEAAGLQIFERDGRLYAFPLMLRVQPGDMAVRIGKKVERGIRPSELVRRLAALQKRPQRLREQPFLELLYRAYQRLAGPEWRRVEHGWGPHAVLADLHEVLTLLPGVDYALDEFGRDLLLLDRRPELRTRDGAGFRLGGSSLTRTNRRIVVYDERGDPREYTAISFGREG
jgi:hypothetical protein